MSTCECTQSAAECRNNKDIVYVFNIIINTVIIIIITIPVASDNSSIEMRLCTSVVS